MCVSVCVCHLISFEQMNKQHSIQERQLFQGSLCVVFFMRLPTMWYHVDVSEARKQHNHVSEPTMRRFSNWDLLAKTRNQIFWTRTSSFFNCFSSLKTAPKDYKTYRVQQVPYFQEINCWKNVWGSPQTQQSLWWLTFRCLSLLGW